VSESIDAERHGGKKRRELGKMDRKARRAESTLTKSRWIE